MADQFNDSIPAVANQITEDVADIAETLGYIKDVFQNIVKTWNNTVATTIYVNKFQDMTTAGNVCLLAVVDIGDWNMDTFDNLAVAHDLIATKIRHVTAIIRNDAATAYYPLPYKSTDAYISNYDATSVNFLRAGAGTFDSTDFNSTSFNRGWIYIWYVA